MRTNQQNTSLLIQKLGCKMIVEIYSIVGAEPVYFSMLHTIVRRLKIKGELNNQWNNQLSVSEIARHNNVCKMTVYRMMKYD